MVLRPSGMLERLQDAGQIRLRDAGPIVGHGDGDPPGAALGAKPHRAAFLLASYDLAGVGAEDWRAGIRGDVFATRHPAATPSILNEDGHAATVSLSWQHFDWLRVTGEMIAMQSRRREYLLDGFPSAALSQQQLQLSARFFF
jgi:hypothetical protein